jgi:hypothetical protein
MMGRRKETRKKGTADQEKLMESFPASGPYADFMKRNTIMPNQKLKKDERLIDPDRAPVIR